MSRRVATVLAIAFGFLLSNCGDSDTSSGGGSGGSAQQDGGNPDAAVGPWECLEGNIARRKSDGETKECGLLRCTVVDGCGNEALGCTSDEDCVERTSEAGWDVDLEVKCENKICSAPHPASGG